MILFLIQEVPDAQLTGGWGSITWPHFCEPCCRFSSSLGHSPGFHRAVLSFSRAMHRMCPTLPEHLQTTLQLLPQMCSNSPWSHRSPSNSCHLRMLPTVPTWSTIHPPASIYMENRFREGEIDNSVPDILIVGWTAIYLVSDQTYQLWTKFHNCRRLFVATCNKKCGILHYGWSVQCTQICPRG